MIKFEISNTGDLTEVVQYLPPLHAAERDLARRKEAEAKPDAVFAEPPASPTMELVPVAVEVDADPVLDNEILHRYVTIMLMLVGTLAFLWVAYEVIEAIIPLFRQWAIELMEVVLDAAKAVAIAAVYIVGAIGLAYLVVLWIKSLFSASPKDDFPHLVRHETLPGNSTTPKTRKFVQTFEEIIEE